MDLIVNGRTRAVEVDPETPLLYVLRNDLGLKATRYGCGIGACGACTVLIDGRPVTSCDTPVSAVAGQRIATVEGLADGEAPHPLQRAFIELQAAQCGYCISGILMRAKALLDERPHPSEAEIRVALDPSLCRCGSHARIVRAVQRAAETG